MSASTTIVLGLGRLNITRITREFIVIFYPHVEACAASIMLHDINDTHHNVYHGQNQEVTAIDKKLKCK